MGSDSTGASQDSRDDDDEEEYEEAGSGNRFLGFMFGNVDNSGDLDADYLDEEAKEHLAALADKLGSSLTDIDLSVKSPRSQPDAAEQDYDEKADDAVDYEDIDEQYEGPEVQAAGEEENLFPEKEYLSAEIPFANISHSNSVFDDENYDEEEEPEKEPKMVDNLDSQIALSEVQASEPEAAAEVEVSSDHELHVGTPDAENFVVDYDDYEEMAPKESSDDISPALLPVLCIENGMVILRFSEIFGIQESLKRRYKRDHVYLIHKERLKPIDAPDLVEEDEEAFLRGFPQEFSSMKQEHQVQEDIMETLYDGMVSEKFGLKANEQLLDSFLGGVPMKEDLTIDLSTVWDLPRSPNFYLLDQQDWENSILWGANSMGSDDSVEVHDTSGLNSEVKELGNETTDGLSMWAADIFKDVEIESDLEDSNLVHPSRMSHPQLLRLESRVELENSSHPDGREENNAPTKSSKFSLHNRRVMEGSWLDDIIWEPKLPFRRHKLIFDLEDRQMLFEVEDEKNESELWLHAGAMLITRSSESHGHDLLELPVNGNETYSRFDIANDIFYSNRKTSQQLHTSSEKRTAYGVEVYHSASALKLETMKPKLSNKDIANFHRPKALWYPHDNEVFKEQGKLPTLGPMKFIVKSLGGKGSKLHVGTEETISLVKAKASKKLDFKPPEPVKIFYRGKELEDDKSLSAQNVQPNSLLHVVRTKVHLLPRAQKIPSENKSLRPPGAFKKKSELSVKDGHVFLMEYCEERPLLLSNTGMGARFCTYYQKTAPSDQTGNLLSNESRNLGSLLTLDPADKSPFLGEINPGSTQSSLETNMFRSPVFSHKVSSTDYLLVRSAKGKLSLRRIDKINVVGQQEPLMEVMSPGSKELQFYLLDRVAVHMFREFRALKKRNLSPCILANELVSLFPHLCEVLQRNRLKKYGFDLKREHTGQWIWKLRPNVNIPSEEALRKRVPPEKVCAYESMLAGLYRLKHLGITKLMNPTGIASAMSQLPNEAIALAAASHIERELQITPWSLSSNFVACTNQVKENLERLEISGVGDPSGRGLGFSYVRSTPKAPVSNAMTKKKAAVKGTTVTGTDADLRRLSMEAAREVLLKFNVPDEIIAKLTRWHRIAMIRELSSEQAASGVKVDTTTISKYARGQRMSFVQLQQQTREKCQEIWDRQLQSLTGIEEGASDSESNSDLDSFAGDLENLLDAEECEGDEVTNEPKHDRSDGVKGLKMRRYPSQTEVEEKVEDEAAEAAELCRMLMDDEKTGLTKKKKAGPARKEGGSVVPHLGLGSENGDRIKKPKKMVKQIISSTQPDRAYNLMENISGDKKDVEALVVDNNFMPKVKAKKVKILGDGMKIFKEKKSARESFVCGACGKLGHMRTNKNCPRYGEDPETQADRGDPDKISAKSLSLEPSSQQQQKPPSKKFAQKNVAKAQAAQVEAPEGEKSLTKVKSLKLKCGSVDKILDNSNPRPYQSSDQVAVPVAENKPATKVSKIVISSKSNPGDIQVEQKPNIVIRPPDRGQAETPKTSIVFRPPVAVDRAQVEPPKPSIVIKPPTDVEKERAHHKRIKIKRSKEAVDVDQLSQEGSVDYDYRKTKKIVELSDFESCGREGSSRHFSESSSKRKAQEEQSRWEEEEKRRHAVIAREERTRRIYMQEARMLEEQERLAEIERYEVSIRREREEEERLKAKKKKKKMKRIEVRDHYEEDYGDVRRNDRRIPERDRAARRRPFNEPARPVTDFAPPTKRRRGGEVGLANILERIVEVLRSRQEVSYLFLKPVTKKEAPDYLDIVERPMDLSTIRDKVRRLEYRNSEEFRHDVWQISYNAHVYNDRRNPGIPPLADQLLELCDYLLRDNKDSLIEAEQCIEGWD